MTEPQIRPEAHDEQDEPAVYTAYEIDFMIGLRSTDNGRITREEVGLRGAPDEAEQFVRAAVTSGLRARGKVERSAEGQWLLGEEGQIIATALTSADRWLSVALSEGEAMRMAFVIKAEQAVLMLTQDELDSFIVSALPAPSAVPASITDVVIAFLQAGPERTVSLRRRDLAALDQQIPLMFHADQDGDWKVGHLPLDEEGVLTVAPVGRAGIAQTVGALWDHGISKAPQD